jgi:glycosyltransferase involved in cell wall biosynthesis
MPIPGALAWPARVAIVHDFLTQRGGAERVVLHLCRIFEGSTIFTSVYCPETTYAQFAACEVRATRLLTPSQARSFRRNVLAYPGMFRAIDLSDFDLAVVSSSAFAHHVRHPRSLVYWHTPPRFLYDPSSYLPARLAPVASFATRTLRRRDHAAAVAHPIHIANSARTAERLARSYGIEARVLHPPLAPAAPTAQGAVALPRRTALVVSRLLAYKRVDVAVEACRIAGLPLTVVGEGPELADLEAAGRGSEVRFLSGLSDEELQAEYSRAAVVLCPAAEDFGYVPLEAASAGRPVVAQRAGGAAESVVDGLTGLLVEGWDPAVWADAISTCVHTSWQPDVLQAHAASFGASRFDSALRETLAELLAPAGAVRREVVRRP